MGDIWWFPSLHGMNYCDFLVAKFRGPVMFFQALDFDDTEIQLLA
jgi:hypothetical protein